jgi:hypothetical protein
MRKKNPVVSNLGKFICFNNNVSNLYNNSVVEKIYGMAYNFTLLMFRKSNKTTIIQRDSFSAFVLMRKKKPVISNKGHFFCFNSTVSYTYIYMYGITILLYHVSIKDRDYHQLLSRWSWKNRSHVYWVAQRNCY